MKCVGSRAQGQEFRVDAFVGVSERRIARAVGADYQEPVRVRRKDSAVFLLRSIKILQGMLML